MVRKVVTINFKQIVIDFLLSRDGKCCQFCRQPFSESSPPEIDHIRPRTKGGTDEMNNFQLLHHICNIKKGRRLHEDANGQFLLIEKPVRVYRKIGYGDEGLWGQVDRFIISCVADALGRTGFNQKRAAIKLSISYRAFRHLLDKYGLQKVESSLSPNGWVITIKGGSVVWPTEYDPINETI